ncbi:MAG: L,D-transpeptidase family protein [Desulfuromonadales bacterium]|nr:L,D-transpeptidase family protein [Desulfuromonadales bacterium]
MKFFILAGCILLSATFSHADSRSDAREAIALLRQTGVSQKISDEIASIRAAFATADEYMQRGDHEQAERYYLLTIQKSHVLMPELSQQAPETSETLPSDAVKSQPVSPTPTTEIPLKMPDGNRYPIQKSEQALPPEASTTEWEDRDTSDMITSGKLVGSVSVYTVKKRDSLRLIAAKLGVSQQHLIQMNNLDPKPTFKPGQSLRYNNRKIIPQHMPNGIVINIPDRTLYFFKDGKLASSLPVALGVAKKGRKFDWTTPTGKFKVVAKQKDPTWFVPRSIQSEMEEKGKEVITSMPPGPRNPLGKYAIKTSLPGILIHSTTKPGSIYSFASHGCIRVYPEQMENFFKDVRVNTVGEIIYRPVKLAITEEGRVFLEVHHDVYGKSSGLPELAKQLIEKHNISDRVNWNKVESVVKRKAGLAVDITL